MTQAKRPGGRTARVRAKILTATVELLARDGVSAFKYEEVADRAGVHKTSVYRNWPDRNDLVIEALSRHADQQIPLADTGDLRTDVADFLLALAAELETPFGRALVNAVQSREYEEVTSTIRGVFDRRLATLRSRLERATLRGELPPVDPLFFTHMISGPVHLYRNRADLTFSRLEAERITDVVLAGIRATASQGGDLASS
ncbi:DNA-binding transcriptional regulator, AcrR family [Amycolatopsis lurida]|uniref:TetR family transcriptional regulator n=1 Tax=Amycolatopsis lurida NRRL 2430 TaxID=1460371 RepID=A0A2P2FF05_AMYLU|nr:TetR/AcrR family transcriptional regulator [Amycolatopsis lurida]KFU75289.1 TetR family transcriptional regulator [Amycolatopsis lurida NRRL 2430]SEE31937.1 DNA-binding transcriptional regulator, AcrR family [Amycolatopsis lurida]